MMTVFAANVVLLWSVLLVLLEKIAADESRWNVDVLSYLMQCLLLLFMVTKFTVTVGWDPNLDKE